MIDLVDQTLQLWRSQPFVYGGVVPHRPGVGDCMLSIGDYLAACGFKDVTGLFRGKYADEAGALAQMAAYGGAAGLIAMTGVKPIGAAIRGSVVTIDTGTTEIGALCTGSFVAVRLDRGVCEVPMRLVRIAQAWGVD